MRITKLLFSILFISMVVVACENEKVKMETEDAVPFEAEPEEEKPKGELAFLTEYGGRLPEDVGFLTNHIVERRLAGLMKDSFIVLSAKTAYSTPITVAPNEGFVAAKFFNDKEEQDLSSMIIIDTRNEIFWVYYYNGDSLVKFTDNPSSPSPGMP